MEADVTYTVRSDVDSDDAKLMREKGLSWFHNRGWTREKISDEKFKEIHKWVTKKGNVVYTHTSFRSSQYTNVFINEGVYNKWINFDGDFYFVLADKRKKFPPMYLHIKEVRLMNLKYTYGVTPGRLIPQENFHEFDKRTK